jgi:hypothetical protein
MSDYLEKYNPSTPLFASFQVDDTLPKSDRAFAYWKTLLTAKRSSDGLFLVIGRLLKTVRDEKLYEALDYENFTQFLASEELGFSREKAYLCIKVYEYYIEYLQLDPNHIAQLNISRLSLMVPILRQIEDKAEVVKQIEDYSSLRHGEFVRQIKERTDTDGKPTVYWSNETERWIVNYHEDITLLVQLGNYGKSNTEE